MAFNAGSRRWPTPLPRDSIGKSIRGRALRVRDQSQSGGVSSTAFVRAAGRMESALGWRSSILGRWLVPERPVPDLEDRVDSGDLSVQSNGVHVVGSRAAGSDGAGNTSGSPPGAHPALPGNGPADGRGLLVRIRFHRRVPFPCRSSGPCGSFSVGVCSAAARLLPGISGRPLVRAMERSS
jgi:hypothetical protein